jgi:hypothetical protein
MRVPFQAVAVPGQAALDGFVAALSFAGLPAHNQERRLSRLPSSASSLAGAWAFGADLSVLLMGCHSSDAAGMGALRRRVAARAAVAARQLLPFEPRANMSKAARIATPSSGWFKLASCWVSAAAGRWVCCWTRIDLFASLHLLFARGRPVRRVALLALGLRVVVSRWRDLRLWFDVCSDHLSGFGGCCLHCLAAVYCVCLSRAMHLGWALSGFAGAGVLGRDRQAAAILGTSTLWLVSE